MSEDKILIKKLLKTNKTFRKTKYPTRRSYHF